MKYISFQQVLELPEFKNAKVLGGLKKDTATIKCGHVIELPDVEAWIDYGELLFMTGVGLDDIESNLFKIVKDIKKKGAAGLVLQIGPYIQSIPKAVIARSKELEVPLITLPFNIRLNDIMTSIYMLYYEASVGNESVEAIMRKVLYYDFDDSLVENAIHFGYHPDQSYISLILQPDCYSETYSIPEMSYTLRNFFSRELTIDKKCFILPEGNSYVIMLPIYADYHKSQIYKFLERLQNKIASLYKEITVSIGIGDKFSGLKELKRSTKEAKYALQLLRACNRKNTIRFYNEIGVYQLFFGMKDNMDLKRMLQDILGSLIDYDRENGTSFVDTLEVYLDHNKNIGLSAEQLFIHRNTLKYRVNKAQTILAVNLEDANICFNLRLAFKIKRFLFDIRN